MRRSLRAVVAALPLAALVPGGLASADTIVDADTLLVPAPVDLGVVCPTSPDRTAAVPLGVQRTGAATSNGNIFANDQELTVFHTGSGPVSIAGPATLSLMPEAITLPPDAAHPVWHWLDIAPSQGYVQRLSPAPTVTLDVPAFVPGAARVAQSASVQIGVRGTKHTGGTLQLFRSVSVRWSLGSTADCAAADTEDPTIALSHSTADGANGWFVTAPVQVSVTASDNVGVDRIECADNGAPVPLVGGALAVTGDGVHSLSCTAYDAAGNDATATDEVRIDTVAPSVSLSGPDGVTVDFGDPLPSYGCEATDATSGLAAPCAVTGADAGSVGTHTVTASATDNAGLTGSATATYTVRAWTLEGFYRPVDPALLNTVKAGSTVPLKFNVLKGDPGVPLTTGIGATFSARTVGCDTSVDVDAIEQFATTGRTELRYDAEAGQWVQSWATPKSGAGQCFRVTLTTADGSSRSAYFKLK